MAFLNASRELVGSPSVTGGRLVISIVLVRSDITRATVMQGRSIKVCSSSSDVVDDIIAGTSSRKSATNVCGFQARICIII